MGIKDAITNYAASHPVAERVIGTLIDKFLVQGVGWISRSEWRGKPLSDQEQARMDTQQYLPGQRNSGRTRNPSRYQPK